MSDENEKLAIASDNEQFDQTRDDMLNTRSEDFQKDGKLLHTSPGAFFVNSVGSTENMLPNIIEEN